MTQLCPNDHNTNNVMEGGKEAEFEDQFGDLHFILRCPGPLAGKYLPGMCLCFAIQSSIGFMPCPLVSMSYLCLLPLKM